MRKLQVLLLAFAFGLAAFSANLRAEDIDVYVDNASTAGVPNVLFVIDNGANFSANASIGCAAYGGTAEAPSLGTSTGAGILQCALVDAISSLPEGAMNIGLLVSNANNFANDTRASGDAAYHEVCATSDGGCLLRKLTLMTTTSKANLIRFIKAWKDNGTTNASSFNVKVNSALPGTMMQEAWAYYHGKTGMSGKAYGTSLVGTGCQKNFVIYIANTEKEPANENPSPYDGAHALTSAQVGATAGQKAAIFESVKFNTATCGVTSMAPGNNASAWNQNWADEWARLMYQQDGGAGDAEGNQNIVTYTVGITNDQTCTAAYSALLTTMATYGGGKHFKTSNVSDLSRALATILNEVQAVNSVFSSASLPVSVNAEGSFLNQIFLGMFRPDSTGSPRWMGNLKQYQLVRNSAGNLVMGGADGEPAVSSAGTGFITPTAVSLWTSKDIATSPDSLGGFFINDPKGTPAGPFDKPDGEVVEKGGVAQQLRLANLTATFTGASNTSSNPRRLYTYCPAGSSCVSSLMDATNDFSTANVNIASNAFGSANSVPIASIVRTGTNALVTTNGNHGFTSGSSITISNVTQPEYNVTQTLTASTVNSSTTFTITGLPDYPTSPSQGTYTVATVSGSSFSIASMERATSTTSTANDELVTITTAAPHGFTTAADVVISGATPAQFNFSGKPVSASGSTLTFRIAIEPPASNANTYRVALSPTAYPPLTNVELTNPVKGEINGDTKGGSHNLHAGQKIAISVPGNKNSKYAGTYTIASVPTATTFTITGAGNDVDKLNGATGTIEPDTTTAIAVNPGAITRTGTTATGTATMAGLTSGWFGAVSGGTKVVRISKASGSAINEDPFVDGNRDITITCQNLGCTTVTYDVTISPAATATGAGMSVALAGAGSVNLAAGSITRSGAAATLNNLTANLFGVGLGATQTVTISASGSALSSEADYLGTWTITCANASCTTATFGPVSLTPATPATGANMQVYSGSTPPDRDTVIKWVRGLDNQADEKGPGSGVTVRPSIHGDVLHSRPLVVNYGDSRGIVVFYGANDGVFRAVNGNQSTAIGSIPAGGELWGLVLPEHYASLNRLRMNSPELKFPASFLSTARPKDYFVDGPTGSYQTLNSDGTVHKAILYITMRRGGRYLYAVDVSTPTDPKVIWRISGNDTGFEELGQTWSRPRLTVLQNLNDASTPPKPVPVLVFGAGYDTAQDSEPPTADSMGRGIFVINAETGALIWTASRSCNAALESCKNVPGMKYAIPSEIGFVDRDNNGRTDKFYFGDLGGNLWRADVAGAVSTWTVTRVAQLGCSAGACASGVTPRKFFFPPSVLSIRKSDDPNSFEMLSISSGDREHPLKSDATGSSYSVNDRFFMIKDTGTQVGLPVTQDLVPGDLDNATTDPYVDSATKKGFYVHFSTGEKGVNAPLAVNGQIFFATNRPIDRSKTCAANLGEAKAYAVSPFDGSTSSSILAGGGIPPSAVTGIINIVTNNPDGTTTTKQEKFCIGCGLPGKDPGEAPPCNSALENCSVGKSIPKNLRRTYWYKK